MPFDEMSPDAILAGRRPSTPWDMLPPDTRHMMRMSGMENPFSIPDPIGQQTRRMMGLPAWRPPAMDYISEEQEQSLKEKLGQGAMTSLGWMGSMLEKFTGSRALKGAMAGKWDELLSIIPGSDKIGLTDPSRTTSAREALQIQEDPYSNWDNALSFAGEILLDPSIPLTGFLKGGLTAGGKALRAAGGLKDVDYALQTAKLATGAKAGKLGTRRVATLAEGLKALPDRELAANLTQQISKAAGDNASKMQGWLDEPIGKSLEFGVPFSSKRSVGFNVPGIDAVRDSTFKLIGDTVGLPIKKHLWAPVKGMSTAASQKVAAMFTHRSTRLPKYVDQLLAMYHAETKQFSEQIRTAREGLERLKADPLASPADLANAAKAMEDAERGPVQAAIEHYRRLELRGGRGLDQDNPLDAMVEIMRTTAAENRKRFAFGEALDDLVPFVHRSFRDPDFMQKVAGEIQPLGGAAKDAARSEGLKMIPGGTGDIMEIASDPRIIEASKKAVKPNQADPLVEALEAHYKHKLPYHFPGVNATFDEAEAAALRLTEMVRILRAAPKEQMARGLFHHPAIAAEKYLRRQADLVGVAEAQLELVARTTKATEKGLESIKEQVAKLGLTDPAEIAAATKELTDAKYASLADYFRRVPREDKWLTRSVMKPLRPMGQTLDEARKLGNPLDGGGYVEYIKQYGTAQQKAEMEGAKQIWDAAVRSGDEKLLDTARKQITQWATEFGESVKLPKAAFDDMVRWEKVFVAGDQIGDLGKFVDSWTSMFKASVLTRPSRYTRDLVSGQLMSMMLGQWSPGVAMRIPKYLKTGIISNPKEFLGAIITDPQALQAMSDDEALKILNAHITAQWTSQGRFLQQSQIGAAKDAPAHTIEKMSQDMFGERPIDLRTVGAEFKPLLHPIKNWRAFMPHEIKGVNPIPGLTGEPAETVNAFVRAGDAAGKLTDTPNVLVPYLTLLQRGVAPDEALRRVLAAQVDYSAKSLTSLEKNILVRAFPFWRFTSKMMPFVLSELMDRPAGIMAQTIRTAGRAGEDDFVPQQLRDTMAIPVSSLPFGEYLESKDPERKRYFTGLGLMHEDVTSFFEPGADLYQTTGNLLREFGGRMNPYAKAAAEIAFDKHLFSGRDLRDMQGRAAQILHDAGLTGDQMPKFSPLVENLLSNSPLAGQATFLGTLLDPAKGIGAKSMQLLTGARISDVNREKAREIALREAIEDQLRGKPGVHTLRPHMYVPEAERDLLSDPELLLMDLYRQQLANAKRRAAARKVQAGPGAIGQAQLQEMLSPSFP